MLKGIKGRYGRFRAPHKHVCTFSCLIQANDVHAALLTERNRFPSKTSEPKRTVRVKNSVGGGGA